MELGSNSFKTYKSDYATSLRQNADISRQNSRMSGKATPGSKNHSRVGSRHISRKSTTNGAGLSRTSTIMKKKNMGKSTSQPNLKLRDSIMGKFKGGYDIPDTTRNVFFHTQEIKTIEPRMKTPSHVGTNAKRGFYESCKTLPKIKQKIEYMGSDLTATTAYVSKCEENRLIPQPLGLVRKKGSEEEINLRAYNIGDMYAECLSESLAFMPQTQRVNLSKNRLSPRGCQTLIAQLMNTNLRDFDISYNRLGYPGCVQVAALLQDKNYFLRSLNLESCGLNDTLIKLLLDPLTDSHSLQELNLAKNNLTDTAAIALGQFLMYSDSLVKFSLHWNKIKSKGFLALCEGLRHNDTVRMLDFSWNHFGGSASLEGVISLAQIFATNKVLMHVDFSHNNFTTAECEYLAEGLENNRTIYGIHMEGNACTVDSVGFIHPCEDDFKLEITSGHVRRRIMGDPSDLRPLERGKPQYDFMNRSNCWICENWQEAEYIWQPGRSGAGITPEDVFLHLSFEDYECDLMDVQENGSWTRKRMVPPGPSRYMFTVNDMQKAARDKKKVAMKKPLKREVHFTEEPQEIEITKVNIQDIAIFEDIHNGDWSLNISCLPREKKRRLAQAIRPRTPWDFKQSIFNNYVADSDELRARCFEYDWKCSRIPNLIKNPEQLSQVKAILRASYKSLREVYKYYSAIGAAGGVFSIGQNTFTDLANNLKLTDNKTLKLADLDFNFISTNSGSSEKNNPRNPKRALVRYQLMEILTRLALNKFVQNGEITSAALAIDTVIHKHLLINYGKMDCHTFRENRYWKEDVDLVYKAWKPVLDAIYKRYSGKASLPGQAKFMCLEEFENLVADSGILDDDFFARDADVCFNLSMMTQVDELNSDRHFQMQPIEFYEALARVVDKWRVQIEGFPNPALGMKIERYLTKLLQILPASLRDNFVIPPSVAELEELYYWIKSGGPQLKSKKFSSMPTMSGSTAEVGLSRTSL